MKYQQKKNIVTKNVTIIPPQEDHQQRAD